MYSVNMDAFAHSTMENQSEMLLAISVMYVQKS